ncbi:MAG: hypothetical protein AAB334_01680 [Patescibacteria group bacterium]
MTIDDQNNEDFSNKKVSSQTNVTDKRNFALSVSIVITALILGFAWIYTVKLKISLQAKNQIETETQLSVEEAIELPLRWDNLGVQMIDAGVINQEAFESIYAQRGGLDSQEKQLLLGKSNGTIKINQQNAGFFLNFLWAFGLSNKNSILENGPMMDPQYGGTENFASTGGWTIANGNIMNHYSAHSFVVLTKEQQELVERVSKNIYRPCCGNSTYFPDCNHGMAMLGLLELLAAQGIDEQTIYKVALEVNKLWFPEQYNVITQYLLNNNKNIENINPREILGINYSSASGYGRILQSVGPQPSKDSVNCSIGGESTAPAQSSGSGCGI